MKAFWDLIVQSDVITLFRHVIPDGDAFGSQLGLKELLAHRFPEKKIYCLGQNPTGTFARLFAPMDEVDDATIANSLAVVLDTANAPRVDDQRFLTAKQIIKIDHHINNGEEFTPHMYCNQKRIACAEMIVELALNWELELTPLAAKYLFVGITTDSGRLLYANVSAFTYQAMAHLSSVSIPRDQIHQILYQSKENDVRIKGFIQSQFKTTANGVAYLYLNAKTLARINGGAWVAGLVNTISGIDGYEVSTLLAQDEDGAIRCELRSKRMPVNEIAVKYGGGGHLLAAGCRLADPALVKALVKDLDQALLAFRKKTALAIALEAASAASAAIMEIYHGAFNVEIKDDDSPVTTADLAANQAIAAVIKNHLPFAEILSEEAADDPARIKAREVWIVDPLDGTKSFIEHSDEFAVNIALSYCGELLVGVVALPALGRIYYASKGDGAFVLDADNRPRPCKTNRHLPLRVALSRHHQSPEELAWLDSLNVDYTVEHVGSALKLCGLAEGRYSLCVKLSPGTKEWDTAAPALIISEAGGCFTSFKGEPFTYNRRDVYNRDGYFAAASKQFLKFILK